MTDSKHDFSPSVPHVTMLPVVSILKRNRGVAAAAGAGAGPRTRTRSLYSDQVLAQHYANYTDIIEKIR